MPIPPSPADADPPSRARRDAAMRAGQLAVRSERQGSTCVVGLSGELDLATVPALEDELHRVEASDAAEIVLDLSALDFIDSSGLQLIIAADARSKANGKRLQLVPGQPHVHRIFVMTATVDRLPFSDS